MKRAINSALYERTGLSTDKAAVLAGHAGTQPLVVADVVKTPYVLEFLGLEERASYSESDLETAIIVHLQSFLVELRRSGVAYHRAGVLLSGLESGGQSQLGLFAGTAADQQRSHQLMAAMDALNARFGRQLVRVAAAGVAKNAAGQPQAPAWAGRSAHRSPLYTTKWDELWLLRCG